MAREYNFGEVVCIIGPHIVGGWAEGDDVCTVEFDEDSFDLHVGAGGEATRSQKLNRAATITIRLAQSSPSNRYLSTLHAADLATGEGKVPAFVKDNSGDSVYTAAQAWIQKAPTSGFGSAVNSREWVLRTGAMVAYIGGND